MHKLKMFVVGFMGLLLTADAAQATCGQMGGSSAGQSLALPFLLLSLVGGYWVLTLAINQAKTLNVVGKIVGVVVMLVAVCGLVCMALCGMCRGKKSMCSVGSAKTECTYSMGDAHKEESPTPVESKK
jgi:hypothetical protein